MHSFLFAAQHYLHGLQDNLLSLSTYWMQTLRVPEVDAHLLKEGAMRAALAITAVPLPIVVLLVILVLDGIHSLVSRRRVSARDH